MHGLHAIGIQLEEILEEFDATTNNCECCNATRYEDIEDFKSSEAVGAALTRIEKVIQLQKTRLSKGGSDV